MIIGIDICSLNYYSNVDAFNLESNGIKYSVQSVFKVSYLSRYILQGIYSVSVSTVYFLDICLSR